MDFNNVQKVVQDESTGGELLIYVAVGCALGRYPAGEHPKQQCPPYIDALPGKKICILIDPMLEDPPRANAESSALILPIRAALSYTPLGFLQNLIDLCMDSSRRVRMIVHDFTGADINAHYPTYLGETLYKRVLFDPTYGDGGCFPDLAGIRILCDGTGNFLQPKYSRLQDIQKMDKNVLISEFKVRQYPIVHLIARMYRIQRGLEEFRDWCTGNVCAVHLDRFCLVYKITESDYDMRLRRVVELTIQDLCVVSESYLSDEEIDTIVESPGRELENMWKTIGSILAS